MPANQTLIVFGATGDLCGRHLLPALARLFVAGELPAGFRFIGTGPQRWEVAAFQDHVRTRLASFAADLDAGGAEAFIGQLSYRPVDVLDPTAIGELVRSAPRVASLTFYLALPTQLIGPAVDALGQVGLPASARIAVEKPFGSDLASAEDLNAALARVTSDDSQVFRVDHFLGMPVIAALPSTVARLRRSSAAPADSGIAKVSILWEETLALEGRAAFYDRAGALKDLLQNHLLQILCQVTMDGSDATAGGGWWQRRLQALRAVQIPTADQVAATTRRARYTAGTLPATDDGDTVEVPDYIAEEGVEADRGTETFAQVSLQVDAPGWSGTEFVLRAGKAMGRRRCGILAEFRTPTAGADAGARWIDFDVPVAAPGDDAAVESAPLEQIAYVAVLRDLLSGAGNLSVSRAETELAWRIFTPILQEWTAGTVPLETYPAGTTPDRTRTATR